MASLLVKQSLFMTSKWTSWRRMATVAASQTSAGGITGLGKKKVAAKTGPTLEKIVLPVETDTHKLVTYCCGSCITKEGEDVKLKEDHEYPEWLWKLRTGKPPRLDEIEYDTKYYWQRLRRIAKTQQLKLMKVRRW